MALTYPAEIRACSPVGTHPVAVARRWLQRRARQIRPLRAHVVICGFPRSGTTLLHLMIQTAVPRIQCFGRERAALDLLTHWPRAPFLVTKRPADVFFLDRIRDHYAGRARFVVCLRDPRSVLTSKHANRPGEYYVTPERWRAIDGHVQAVASATDVCLVNFTDLVTDTQSVQARLDEFVGWKSARPFADYHLHLPAGVDVAPLNGVRAVDPHADERWREPAHRERIRTLLRELPELPERLIAMGYERDTNWLRNYAM